MCDEHYIEALEHGAHLDFGECDGADKRIWDEERRKTTRLRRWVAA